MQQLRAFLPATLRQLSSNEEAALIFIRELWPQIAGQDVARRTTPVALRRATLMLEVESEAWMNELVRYRGLLIRSVNNLWGRKLVRKIRLGTLSAMGEFIAVENGSPR
ncbi:MAG: DUF721 domain-containing protein [Acidobacteriota bacterium]